MSQSISFAKSLFRRTRNLLLEALGLPAICWHKMLASKMTIKKTLNQAWVDLFFFSWPAIYKFISKVNRIVPMEGRIRRIFENFVFTSHWNRHYKLAYIPDLRDLFFEHIVTFFYRYPISKGDIVVQVGASSGEEARRFARAVGRKGRLIAVEPEPGNVAKLHESFPKEQFPQVSIVPKGAWNAHGELKFFVGGEKEHRLVDLPAKELTYEWWGVMDHLQESRYKGTVTVPVDTIDHIVAEAGVERIDFILFETNGAELEGVKGMDSILPITKRIAARGHVMRDGVPIYIEIEKYLSGKGFETMVTSEGMVLAQQPHGWRMPLVETGSPK